MCTFIIQHYSDSATRDIISHKFSAIEHFCKTFFTTLSKKLSKFMKNSSFNLWIFHFLSLKIWAAKNQRLIWWGPMFIHGKVSPFIFREVTRNKFSLFVLVINFRYVLYKFPCLSHVWMAKRTGDPNLGYLGSNPDIINLLGTKL
jgi:hypothetical protein